MPFGKQGRTRTGFALSLVQFFPYATGAAFKHVSDYYQCRLHQHVRAMFSAIRIDPAKHVAFRIIRQDIRFLIRKRAVDRSTHVPQNPAFQSECEYHLSHRVAPAPPNHGSFSLTFCAHADVTSAAISNAIPVLMTILKPEYDRSSHRTASIAIHSLPENCHRS